MRTSQTVLVLLIGIFLTAAASMLQAAEKAEKQAKLRAGIIGCDTSHVPAFAKLLNMADPTQSKEVQAYLKVHNDPHAADSIADVKVVAAFPGGSKDLPSSWDRVPKYTEELRKMGIEISNSIPELMQRVDVVLLESVDGRPHLEQARPVILAGKPLFIDKPMAASLADGLEIFRLAKEHNVPCFSASSLRFSAGAQAVRNKTGPYGDVKSCVAWSPLNFEPHHPDLFWYGIHGVETLFTVMGTGCREVTRVDKQTVKGQWADGRMGTFTDCNRLTPAQQAYDKHYGAEIVGTLQSGITGKYDGYAPLVIEICKFFKSGQPPVSAEETLEILAFMEAADASQAQGGAPVTIESMMAWAKKEVEARKK